MSRQIVLALMCAGLTWPAAACASEQPTYRVWVPVKAEGDDDTSPAAEYKLVPVSIPKQGPQVHIEHRPETIDEAFAQIQLRCAAVEAELDKKIRYDTHTRWGLIVTALASSAFAAGFIATAEIVDDGNGPPSTAVKGLRISSAGFAALAGVFTGTSAAIGFEGRLEKRRTQRKLIVQARHDAVALWNTVSPAELATAKSALGDLTCTAGESCLSSTDSCGQDSCLHVLALAWHRATLLERLGAACHMPEVEEVPVDMQALRQEIYDEVVGAMAIGKEEPDTNESPLEEGGDDDRGDELARDADEEDAADAAVTPPP